MVRRFDREGGERVPYISGLSAVQGTDGQSYSYLELVEFLEEQGSSPEADIRELWKRILFSCLVGNTDDHMRNHGFLRDGEGWRLSPVFDINPTPGDGEKFLSNAIDLDDRTASVDVAMRCCEHYRLSPDEAAEILQGMKRALDGWEGVARRDGISAASIERMRSCLDAAKG